MFITDRSYPVLTRGDGNQVALMIMRRASASSGGGPASPLGALPASFTGELPCADCPGIRYALNLFPDKSFFLRTTYIGRADAQSFDDVGRWNLSADGCTLIVSGGKQSSERFAVKSSDVLRKLDLQGREITSNLNYDLRRTSAFERIEPRLAMRGKFRYMADAPTFAECQSGQRWPVSMEGEYKALEGAYLNTRRQAGEELLATIEGQVVMRPNADGGRPTPTLVIERYTGIWPGETWRRSLRHRSATGNVLEVDAPRRQTGDIGREAARAESHLPIPAEPGDRLRRLQQSDWRLQAEWRSDYVHACCRHSSGLPGRNGCRRSTFQSARKGPHMEDSGAASRALR